MNLAAGINGGYYSGGLHTQVHSTTPLEAPHSAGSTHASAASAPPSQSASAPPTSAPGIHGLVSKSVSYDEARHAKV
jgi:hypothetical protein